jgi:hypothetical protein
MAKTGRPKSEALVTARPVSARGGKRQVMVTFHDGRPKPNMRVTPAYAAGTSDAMMDEHCKFWVAFYRAKGGRGAPVAPAADRAAMTKWLDAWNKDRVARGLTSARDNVGHFNQHIGPSTGWAHVRDWTKDTLRKLSRDLDSKVQAAEISWKTAVNIWSTATKMCDDATESKHDEIKCRDVNPAAGVRGPDRGDEISKQFLYPSEFLSVPERVPTIRPARRYLGGLAFACCLGCLHVLA